MAAAATNAAADTHLTRFISPLPIRCVGHDQVGREARVENTKLTKCKRTLDTEPSEAVKCVNPVTESPTNEFPQAKTERTRCWNAARARQLRTPARRGRHRVPHRPRSGLPLRARPPAKRRLTLGPRRRTTRRSPPIGRRGAPEVGETRRKRPLPPLRRSLWQPHRSNHLADPHPD